MSSGCRTSSVWVALLALLLGDEPVNVLLEDVERHRAAPENRVVELPDVELAADLVMRDGRWFLRRRRLSAQPTLPSEERKCSPVTKSISRLRKRPRRQGCRRAQSATRSGPASSR